ncbi:DUF4232 domain-containing protein [Kitasatospora sp. NPDC059827]|uniref:DUF4232 domain-containing protein n=1 Tax=Kitasatospora sp. NPDC059827 TaxID=3346964 RepID=UPI003651895B
MSVRHRRPLLVATVLAGAGLALTACGPDNTDTATGPAPAASNTVAAKPTAGGPGTAGAPTTGTGARPTTHAPSGGSTKSGSGGAAGGPCDVQNLSIHLSARSGAPSQRVIEVQNKGGNACTLSATPGVDLGNSATRDQSKNLKPILAAGTMRYTVAAGKTAYVVLDLDPSGATAGTTPGINEVNVLADDEDGNMPLASIQNFPLGADAKVLNPSMGMYRATLAEAVASVASAPN